MAGAALVPAVGGVELALTVGGSSGSGGALSASGEGVGAVGSARFKAGAELDAAGFVSASVFGTVPPAGTGADEATELVDGVDAAAAFLFFFDL